MNNNWFNHIAPIPSCAGVTMQFVKLVVRHTYNAG